MRVSKGNGFYGKRLKFDHFLRFTADLSLTVKKKIWLTLLRTKNYHLSIFMLDRKLLCLFFRLTPLRIDAFDQNNASKRRIIFLTINEELPQLTIIFFILTTLVLDLDVIV